MAENNSKKKNITQKQKQKSGASQPVNERKDLMVELKVATWLTEFHLIDASRKESGHQGFIYGLGPNEQKRFEKILNDFAPEWQIPQLKESSKDFIYFSGKEGPVWVLKEKKFPKNESQSHYGFLKDSAYSQMRDHYGNLVTHLRAFSLKQVHLEMTGLTDEGLRGAFVGFEMGAYQFKTQIKKSPFADLPQIYFGNYSTGVHGKIFEEAMIIAQSINSARHYVNLPPNILNPSSFSKAILKDLQKKSDQGVHLEIWDQNRLEKEGMGMHVAVGQGAVHAPCLVKISYRPKKSKKAPKKALKPLAFVGKGITFDTGGLDIKPSSGMRLMKKDMGGAAAVLATALWVVESQYQRDCDFYLALAENSVDARSFRPSDLVKARNGDLVEIHNTDAEGRLVLGDALDVAITQKDEPEVIIDLATLTGAIKVALGAEVAGLFSNHDLLADALLKAGLEVGEHSWRMPLVQKYNSQMNTSFADYVNATDGFGGAITAALFLEKFVKQKPWAHLDIYSWNDKAHGGLTFSGGNGQAVQTMIQFLKSYEFHNILKA